jgi:hypothetical protein
MQCESDVAVAVAVGWGQFGNQDRRTSVFGSRYPRTGEGEQTKRIQWVYSQLQTDYV